MPAISPEAISNRVRLANEARALIRRFVAEYCAIDSGLSFACSLVNAVINELAPHETSVSVSGSQDDLIAGSNEQLSLSAVLILIGGIMSFIHFQTVEIAVL
jgi:hypothetical protein